MVIPVGMLSDHTVEIGRWKGGEEVVCMLLLKKEVTAVRMQHMGEAHLQWPSLIVPPLTIPSSHCTLKVSSPNIPTSRYFALRRGCDALSLYAY